MLSNQSIRVFDYALVLKEIKVNSMRNKPFRETNLHKRRIESFGPQCHCRDQDMVFRTNSTSL